MLKIGPLPWLKRMLVEKCFILYHSLFPCMCCVIFFSQFFVFLQLPRKQNLPWLGSSKTTPTNWKIIAFTFHGPLLFLSKPRIKKLVKMYHNNQDQIDYHIHIYIHVPWYVAYWPDISGIKADTTWSHNSLLSRKT